jgi:hypothetical protein
MSASNAPSKRSSDGDKSSPKPTLKVVQVASALKKPKKVVQAAPISAMLWKDIHIESRNAEEDDPVVSYL